MMTGGFIIDILNIGLQKLIIFYVLLDIKPLVLWDEDCNKVTPKYLLWTRGKHTWYLLLVTLSLLTDSADILIDGN